jgi:DNA-binding transcriptional MocR family regulator
VEPISFAGEDLDPDLIPTEELAECAGAAIEADGERILSYGTGAGYTPLRELLAERYGVPPHRVVLTNGWTQGFALLTRTASRQQVVVEYPPYVTALRQLLGGAANVSYLTLSPGGSSVGDLEVYLRASKARLVYTIPTFSNPSGQSLSIEQRWEMVRLFDQYRPLAIEDDSYGLLRYDSDPIPTLFELSGQATVYSTSFSHTIAPGLRVGVFVLPDQLSHSIAADATSTYITPALLSQATVFEFLQRGYLEPHLAGLTQELAARRDTMLDALDRYLPQASWVRPEGGIFVLVTIPPTINAKEMLEAADGVTALAGDDFYGRPNTIRLNFAGCAHDEIAPGVERLGAALERAFDA